MLKGLYFSLLLLCAIITQAYELPEFLREPKNILFGSAGGGSSHVDWVLNVLKELADRGHNITVIGQDNEMKYVRPFTDFHSVSLGPNDIDLSNLGNQQTKLGNSRFLVELYKKLHYNYDAKMQRYKSVLDDTSFDVVLCDHFAIPCVDITANANVPLIVTAALAMSQDATAPYINNFLESNDSTTVNLGFIDRLKSKVAQPISFVIDLKPVVNEVKREKVEAGWLPEEGMPAFEDNWKDALKLVNNRFGFEPARPVSPLVELVGPIMSETYPDLTKEQEAFLEHHKKVAYVAFGQNVALDKETMKKILIAIVDNVERGVLDSFIWVHNNKAANDASFPETITSSSGQSYSFLNNQKESSSSIALITDWAPQMAILSHPSTTLFITHAGLTSLHEAAYAGVRTALYPVYGDQFSNAYMMRFQNLGIQLSDETTAAAVNSFSDQLESVVRDTNGTIRQSVQRFQALVRIHAKHAVMTAADLVEEVLYTHDEDGKLPHRYDVKRSMSFVKAYNLDLLLFLLVVFVTFVGMLGYTIYCAYEAISDAWDSYKIKEMRKSARLTQQESKKKEE